jgi:hypothetical protein
MFARLLATVAYLLSIAPCFGAPDPVHPAERELVVYLKTGSDQPSQPLEAMKREVNALMDTLSYSVSWRGPGDLTESFEGFVVVVELHGVCAAPRSPLSIQPLAEAASLASTAIVDDQVLPFSWLECDTLTRMLAPSLAKELDFRRSNLYGRAMGRLLAHELYHVLTRTRDHDSSGVGKPTFTAKDVLADRFEFEPSARDRVPKPPVSEAETADGGFEDVELGR